MVRPTFNWVMASASLSSYLPIMTWSNVANIYAVSMLHVRAYCYRKIQPLAAGDAGKWRWEREPAGLGSQHARSDGTACVGGGRAAGERRSPAQSWGADQHG